MPGLTKKQEAENAELIRRLARHSAPANENGCILWTGSRLKGRYGRLMWLGQVRFAHRLAWTARHGAIPEGQNVCHRCDMPACINVDHMWLGTQAENVADMLVKGRRHSSKGTANGAAKLTAEQVRMIREDGRMQKEIAGSYRITQATVSAIKRRHTWAHLDG